MNEPMNKQLTLGSLFDGIGGFALAGIYAGMKPVFASEIEPFPIRVTTKRLPEMHHYGDIHALDGAELPPVDVITFGSPCQSLSIAGKRAGLTGGQSSLFFEAIRVIKEMRRATNGQYPRYLVWENVPGALSSANGLDYREVLRQLVSICEGEADVPMPENGKWLPAGEIMGDTYSLAWRILDAAQGWGVAQRRKRIFVVVDLGGQRAGKILFESEGCSGYTPPRTEAWQGTTQNPERRAGASGQYVLNDQGGERMDVTCDETSTLRAKMNGHQPVIMAAGFCTEHSADSRGIGYEEERSPTLRAGVVPGIAIEFNPTDSRIKVKEDGICQTLCSRMGTGGNCVPLTMTAPVVYGISSDQSNGMLSDNPHAGIYEATTSRTLDCNCATPSCNQGGVAVCQPAYAVRSLVNTEVQEEKTPALMARDYKDPTVVGSPAYCMTVGAYGHVAEEKTPTLEARGYKDPPVVGRPDESESSAQASTEYIVRRLTTLECIRLQGYPDGWMDDLGTEVPTEQEIAWWSEVFAEWYEIQGKKMPPTRNRIVKWLKDPATDAAVYKALGNSVAIPCVHFVLAGIVWADGLETWN